MLELRSVRTNIPDVANGAEGVASELALGALEDKAEVVQACVDVKVKFSACIIELLALDVVGAVVDLSSPMDELDTDDALKG
ncbi:hypothetical protein KEM55_001432 [Ascosphaera atra]|nr:hypothetical protein KEM55_001432 [Ascosphaera atra]